MEIFRDDFLNGIFLNQSFLPKSSLAAWVRVKLGLPRLGFGLRIGLGLGLG